MATTKVDVNLIDASGITSSKYLKGDGTWATVDALPSQTSQSGKFLTTDGSTASWDEISGGLTHVSQWSLTADFGGDANPIITNLDEVDAPAGYGKLPASGGSMTKDASTGAFSFPVTGTWWVEFTSYVENSNYKEQSLGITTTTDDSTYAEAARASHMKAISAGFGVAKVSILFNVDNISNCKCKFNVTQSGATVTTKGDTDCNETYMTFMRLGDST